MSEQRQQRLLAKNLLFSLAESKAVSAESLLAALSLLARGKAILNPAAKIDAFGEEAASEDTGSEESEAEAYHSYRRRAFGDVLDELERVSALITNRPPPDEMATFPSSKHSLPPESRAEKAKEAASDEGSVPSDAFASAAREYCAQSFAPPRKPPLDFIASVICESYVESGADALFPDDESLEMIRDALLAYDPDIIEQNRGTNIEARSRLWARGLAAS